MVYLKECCSFEITLIVNFQTTDVSSYFKSFPKYSTCYAGEKSDGLYLFYETMKAYFKVIHYYHIRKNGNNQSLI
jgi:hypothetical protein